MSNIYKILNDFENKNIMFYHTPRTGGSFFVLNIRKIFNYDVIYFSNFLQKIKKNNTKNEKFIVENHFIKNQFFENFSSKDSIKIVLVRNPIDHLYSLIKLYNFINWTSEQMNSHFYANISFILTYKNNLDINYTYYKYVSSFDYIIDLKNLDNFFDIKNQNEKKEYLLPKDHSDFYNKKNVKNFIINKILKDKDMSNVLNHNERFYEKIQYHEFYNIL